MNTTSCTFTLLCFAKKMLCKTRHQVYCKAGIEGVAPYFTQGHSGLLTVPLLSCGFIFYHIDTMKYVTNQLSLFPLPARKPNTQVLVAKVQNSIVDFFVCLFVFNCSLVPRLILCSYPCFPHQGENFTFYLYNLAAFHVSLCGNRNYISKTNHFDLGLIKMKRHYREDYCYINYFEVQ